MSNMGRLDRLIRLGIVIAIAVAYYLGYLSGTWALVLGGAGAVFLLTSLFATCPAYMPFGLSTKRAAERSPAPGRSA